MDSKSDKRTNAATGSKEDGKQNMAAYFDGEVVKWRSKMIRAFGDLHPYEFYVTCGHDFESVVLKGEDRDAVEREEKKSAPFQNLDKMYDIDKKAETEFHQVLVNLENEMPTPALKEFLEDQKQECAHVFELYDNVVNMCNNYFEMEYEDCRKRVQKQLSLQKPTIAKVGLFLTEVEETGDREIASLRKSMATWTQELGSSLLNRINEIYDRTHAQPLAMSVWYDCTEEITSKDIRNAFLADQKEMIVHWKKAFDDLMMLSTELEKLRINYNLTRSKLEKEVFWMERDYKENMPKLTKIQRELADAVNKRTDLKKEIENLRNVIEEERFEQHEKQMKLYERIGNIRMSNRLAHENAFKKCENVLKLKKEEIEEFIACILEGDKFIHEKILNISWKIPDTPYWKNKDQEKYNFSLRRTCIQKNEICHGEGSEEIKTLYQDAFAEAYKLLISSGEFESVLNEVANQLGYMLDFKWVDYVKKALNLDREVKWIELFKVFQIRFVDDLKELKEHMMAYCKLNEEGNPVFDAKGALDGFLHFVCKKRQSFSSTKLDLDESKLTFEEGYRDSVLAAIPNSLLWDGVLELLEKYRSELKIRSRLLPKKWLLIDTNAELDRSLQNYHTYSIPTSYMSENCI